MRAFPESLLVIVVEGGGTVQTLQIEQGIEHQKRSITDSIWSKLNQTDVENNERLLGLGLLWLFADVYGRHDIHAQLLHPDASMFGFHGEEAIVNFKRGLLQPNITNYEVAAVHQVDKENRAIVADFTCCILGKEGRGTDVMKFSEDWRIIQVEAIRHSASQAIVWSNAFPEL